MTALSDNEILCIWELACNQHPVDKAMTILSKAFPDGAWESLSRLGIGKRNGLLLTVREKTFGTRLHGASRCTECKKELEFIADADELRMESGRGRKEVYHMELDECRMNFRLPDSLDLAAIAALTDVKKAGRILARRCILKVQRDETEIPVDNLPDKVMNALSKKLSEIDPEAAMKIEMSCPECGCHLTIPLDIVSFLWMEISAQAKRLLREVKILARFYGWREADILSMSAVRRHYYLDASEK